MEVTVTPMESAPKSIARTSLAFYIRDESRAAIRARRNEFLCKQRAGQDAVQDSPVPSGYRGEFYFIVERQHGSSEETRTQIRRKEKRWQKEQSRP